MYYDDKLNAYYIENITVKWTLIRLAVIEIIKSYMSFFKAAE